MGEGVGAPPIQLGGIGECPHRSSISICSGLRPLKINTLSCNISMGYLWYHSNFYIIFIIGRNNDPSQGPFIFKQVRVNIKYGIANNLTALIIQPCNAVKCDFHEANGFTSGYRASKEGMDETTTDRTVDELCAIFAWWRFRCKW